MVSRRAAAALVAQPVLAQGRRADLARPGALGRASATTTARPPRRRASSCTASPCASASIAATSSPAYEDLGYYLWREGKLPINVDPFDSRLADKAERDRLRQVFERGLDEPVGYALPIAADERQPKRWRSSPWYLRNDHCFLVAGDSPLGFRLPLDSLPWARAGDMPWVYPPDASVDLPPLPDDVDAAPDDEPAWHASGEPAAPKSREHETPSGTHDVGSEPAEAGHTPDAPTTDESAGFVVRTAISAEARHGRLYVFMPPTSALEDYLELVAAVEATAKAMRLPVTLEGYEPPKDPRLVLLRVTPDPGVIEVNVNPASSWSELVEQTTHLYGAARETRLTTEKFMLDGRHTGTGGGNHFVLGGATPGDSPFLRRPDLLASMIAYWHNHPALSYLFSGMFVGPTSQAPRIDEARNDSVYEIEIAFAELARVAESEAGKTPPWLIDRLLRNLLIDVTGNTHRAEFCIDKLYSPDGPTGRLGLLEMRAFEMPPHARMSLVQQLLMRALVARFWAEPYRPARLARWGTELHDRFMLPHFIWEDLDDVIAELNGAGYPFELDWFAAHRDFRFPLLGDFAAAGVAVELRMALEPWHVLGEESGAGGTARYVDSSVERIEVHVQRPGRRSPRDRLQRPARAAAADRHGRRVRRRRALPRLDGAFVAAPDDRRARAAGLRPRRHLDEPLARRLPVPRRPPGRHQLHDLPDQRLRGRGAPPGAVLPHGAHARER